KRGSAPLLYRCTSYPRYNPQVRAGAVYSRRCQGRVLKSGLFRTWAKTRAERKTSGSFHPPGGSGSSRLSSPGKGLRLILPISSCRLSQNSAGSPAHPSSGPAMLSSAQQAGSPPGLLGVAGRRPAGACTSRQVLSPGRLGFFFSSGSSRKKRPSPGGCGEPGAGRAGFSIFCFANFSSRPATTEKRTKINQIQSTWQPPYSLFLLFLSLLPRGGPGAHLPDGLPHACISLDILQLVIIDYPKPAAAQGFRYGLRDFGLGLDHMGTHLLHPGPHLL